MKQNKGLMTEGVIWKQLLLFALPLLLGNLFQQFYISFTFFKDTYT